MIKPAYVTLPSVVMVIAVGLTHASASQGGSLPLTPNNVINLTSECMMRTVFKGLMSLSVLSVKLSTTLTRMIRVAINVVKHGTPCVSDAMRSSVLSVTGRMMSILN